MQPLLSLGEDAGPRVVGADGVDLLYEDGVRAVDMSAQDSAVIFGHSHPHLVAALTRVVGSGFVSETATGAPLRDEAAQRLCDEAFGGWARAVKFTLTGSEAIDLGLGLAQAITGRQALVSRAEAYHGAVGLSRATTTHPVINGALTRPGQVSGEPVDSGVPTRVVRAAEDLTDAELDAALAGAAAVITDHGSGHHYLSPSWFERVGRAAQRAGALWVHDETVSAYGREGRGLWFHFQELAVAPDMVALGKCITGGAAPGSALVLGPRAVEALGDRRWAVGSTYWGHHLQLAATVGTLDLMAELGVVAGVGEIGRYLGERLDELVARHPRVFAASLGHGLNRSLQIGGDLVDGAPDGTSPADVAMAAGRRHGVQASAYGTHHLWVVPPLTIDRPTVDRAVEAWDATARSLAGVS
jgi:4-aminobutyrate aminotransferase-like enzyme